MGVLKDTKQQRSEEIYSLTIHRGLIALTSPVSEIGKRIREPRGRHARESGHPEFFDIPGFRVALAIASSPGVTIERCNEPLKARAG